MASPKSSYVICTTPRSGSWMLCSILNQTGIAGHPAEFFGPTLQEEIVGNRNLAHAAGTEDHMDKLIAASTTENGVFGIKILANQTDLFLTRAAEHQGIPFTSLKTALEAQFPNLKYLWLVREDRVAQAVSLYRASMTNVWLSYAQSPAKEAPPPALAYDRFAIQRAYQQLTDSHVYWEEYFRTYSIAPLRIVYEELLAHRTAVVQHILRYLDLPSDIPIPDPRTMKLSDNHSRAWAEEFTRTKSIPPPYPKPPHRWAPY